MPMPKPNKGESESDFVSRFMGDHEMNKDYPDQAQRAAVAYQTYRSHHGQKGWWDQLVSLFKPASGGNVLPEWLQLVSGDLSHYDPDHDGDMHSANAEVVMRLQEPVGFDPDKGSGMSAKRFGEALHMIHPKRPVTLEINTMGGNVHEGVAMYNMLRARGNVKTRVIGCAASMGAVLSQAGTHRSMMPGTMMVIHNPQGAASGESKDMDKMSELLKKVKDNLVDLFHEHTKVGKRELSEMMDATYSMDAKEAKEKGFIDEVQQGDPVFNQLDFEKRLASLRGGGPGSGPHKGASKDADKASDNAHKATKAANKADSRTKHLEAAKAHTDAATAHEHAARMANGVDHDEEMGHESAADYHHALANYHESEAHEATHNDLSKQHPTKDTMKLTATLAKVLNLQADVDLTAEQIATAAENSIGSVSAELTKLKTDQAEAVKLRVTNRVAKAIEAKLVKAERKDALIAAGIANEAALDFIDDLQPASAAPQKRRGAAPAPVETGPTNDLSTIEAVRAEINENRKSSDVDAGKLNCLLAKEARKLRGHEDLFAAYKN